MSEQILKYKNKSPNQFRQELAARGVALYPQVSGSVFADNDGLFVNRRANNTYLEYTNGVVEDVRYEMYLTEFTSPTVNVARAHMLVFAIELPYSTASVYIESRTQLSLNSIIGISGVELPGVIKRVSLEGGFDDFFRVLAQDEHEVEAVATMAPNFMVRLLEEGVDFDIEFADNHIYLYKTIGHQEVSINNGPTEKQLALTTELYERLYNYGLSSAQMLKRFSRTTRQASATRQPFWQVYQKSSAKVGAYVARILVIIFAIMAGVALLPYVVLPLLAVVFMYKVWVFKARKKKLIKMWRQGGQTALKLK